jgi:hypothetical protein
MASDVRTKKGELVLRDHELAWAVEHALSVHSVAEADRAKLREVDSLGTLRETLLECGLPPEDVARALQTLPAEIEKRRAARTTRIKFVLFWLLMFGALFAGIGASLLWPPLAPLTLVALNHQAVDGTTSRTWGENLTQNGITENAVAKALATQGMPTLTQLGAGVVARLYRDGKSEPSLSEIEHETEATMAVLGSVHCQNQGSVMDTALQSVRADLTLRLVQLRPAKVLGEVRDSAVAVHIDPKLACDVAETKAADKVTGALLGLKWPQAIKTAPPPEPVPQAPSLPPWTERTSQIEKTADGLFFIGIAAEPAGADAKATRDAADARAKDRLAALVVPLFVQILSLQPRQTVAQTRAALVELARSKATIEVRAEGADGTSHSLARLPLQTWLDAIEQDTSLTVSLKAQIKARAKALTERAWPAQGAHAHD